MAKARKAETKAERLVIKVGTGVLTRPGHQLDYNVIYQIVDQVGELRRMGHQVVLVTSGAAGASHGLLDVQREHKALLRLQMMTSVGQPRLMQTYADFFREHNIVVAQALLTRYDFGDRERYLSIREVLEGLLAHGVLPIVNENDVVAGEALTFGDNDFLSAAVASTIGAHRLFLLTTAGGFYAGGDPKVNPKARLLHEVREITPEMWQSCQPTLSIGGRGGMYSKLKAVDMVTAFGIEAYIAPGKEPAVVARIAAGEALGTHFPARKQRMKSYRQWLRFGALSSGKIFVDPGAEKALRNDKSLLPAGITRAEGNFQQGEVVEIYNAKDEKLGMGVVEMDSDVLQAIIAGERAAHRSSEAVHKDRLLMV
ncbi:MAG TPA: glutamate 5-kinase [bacterium]|nr:glutamate 5-kinase [bacterium]HKJ92050.1 glutamate 5-kinase [Longimicrobiales bacterium]